LVIAGTGRGAGKTSVACAVIAATPELRWVAVKMSPHGHEISPLDQICEEIDGDSDKDTGRYLAAGAAQSFLFSGFQGDARRRVLHAMLPMTAGRSLMFESNQIDPAEVTLAGEPVLCLAILAGPQSDWKPSILSRLASADALVLTAGLTREHLSPELQARRIYCLANGQWMTAELRAFVRECLQVQGSEAARGAADGPVSGFRNGLM